MVKRNPLLVMLIASTAVFSLASCSNKAEVLVTIYSTQMNRENKLVNPQTIGTETLEVGDIFTSAMSRK